MNIDTYITEIGSDGEIWRIIKVKGDFPLEYFNHNNISSIGYINNKLRVFFDDYPWAKIIYTNLRKSTSNEIEFMERCIILDNYDKDNEHLLKSPNTEQYYEIY